MLFINIPAFVKLISM